MEMENSLQQTGDDSLQAVIRSIARLWAESTTDRSLARRSDLIHDKARAINLFFAFCRKRPADVDSADVKEWQEGLEGQGLKPSTVYTRICFLSSFYRWAIENSPPGEQPVVNPVAHARPKKPKPYRTERTKSLLDDELRALITFLREKAAEHTNIVAKRDYALLQWYIKTGRRRNEVIALRGTDVQVRAVTKDGVSEEILIVRYRIKGGRFLMCELRDPVVRSALLNYLEVGNRQEVLQTERPLWTRHDRAGRPGAPLTSHAFVKNLKRYAKDAGLDHIHNHMTRHTFARMVSEETGSLLETQEALDHEDQATTRVYVESVSIKRDKFSERISKRVDE
ncbi:MAG: tyrosine-type recombinase/integrase [Pyrinomonadaceae bacterium]